MDQRPLSVTITFILVQLGAFIWLALGVIIALNLHPALVVSWSARIAMAATSIAAACVLFGLSVLLRTRRPMACFALLAALVLASLAVFFDDIGAADLIVLAIHVLPIVLLIRDRGWYLGRRPTG